MNTSCPCPWIRWCLLIGAVAVCGGLAYGVLNPVPSAAESAPRPEPAEAFSEEVHRLCGACHVYPPADTFPRSAWRKEVKLGYSFFHENLSYRFEYPSLEAVVRYYEKRAPDALAPLPRVTAPHACPVHFERRNLQFPQAKGAPGITHIQLAQLFGKDKLDIILCDALNNQVLALSPYAAPPAWRVLAQGLCCAHSEVADLDGDGIQDVVLACLGDFSASDDRVGGVAWLKGAGSGTATPIVLLDGIGRVADVRVADFTGDGKLDLVVAEFGWRKAGAILLLENQTTDWSRPVFVPRILDRRHGTTHVPVADLNGDGRPDFVAVISQEHETIVAFLNEGGGRFRQETIFPSAHPTFGFNGIQLVDMDGDGDLDVLFTNGDALDAPFILKPYHGVTWLENRGQYPFTPHRLADCYGAGSPVVADFDGNGLKDIVVTSFLPAQFFPQRTELGLESALLLEQVAPGKFVSHALERQACDHPACAAGDVDGDGRPDLVIGNFIRGGRPGDAVSLWHNTGKKPNGTATKAR